MFAVAVTIKVVDGRMEDFLPMMLNHAAASLGEAGCVQFDVCTDPEHVDEVFLYEVYMDRAAFDAHTETQHYAAFRLGTKALIKELDGQRFSQVVR